MADLEKAIIDIRETLEKAYPIILKLAGFLEDKDMERAAPGFEELRKKIEPVIKTDEEQLGDYRKAREKFIKEASFTTFNRLVGLKALETRGLLEYTVITKSAATGGLSEAHYLYASRNHEITDKPGQGINDVLEEEFKKLSEELPQLYDGSRYGFLPRGGDTMRVIDLINTIPEEEWKKDDIIGWVYQYYNVKEREKIKNSKSKIDHQTVKYQSQQYTPRWVVKHIVDNTLGRYYLEMYPDSHLYDELEVPIPKLELKRKREPKKLEEIKILDPACGSGNFLLYAFELLYKMYLEQGYSEEEIPSLILKYNLHGIDIDDRAVQLSILNLYLKARTFAKAKQRYTMNIVSTDFKLFYIENLIEIRKKYRSDATIQDFIDLIWERLNEAQVLGSLINIKDELEKIRKKRKEMDILFFNEKQWLKTEEQVLEDIKKFVQNDKDYGSYIQQGMNFAELLIQEYDIVITNPPYLDSSNMEESFKKIISQNYKGFDKNLYSAFIKRCADFAIPDGYVGMITPQTYMFISSYEKMRKWLLENYRITELVQFGLGGVFNESLVDTAILIFSGNSSKQGVYIKLDDQREDKESALAKKIQLVKMNQKSIPNLYKLSQEEFTKIPGSPFVYWISDKIRELFQEYEPLEKYAKIVVGLQTADNDRFLRFWWEVNPEDISKDYKNDRKKWVPYAKGGPYNKWYGNLWWVVNWENDGEEIKNLVDEKGKQKSRPQNESYYFKEGLTYTLTTSSGPTYRKLPINHIFDVKGSAIFTNYNLILPFLSIFNSSLFSYMSLSIRPNVDFQVGGLKTIPIPDPSTFETTTIGLEQRAMNIPNSKFLTLSSIAENCINIKKSLYSFHIIERDFKHDPLSWGIERVRKSSSPDKLIKNALKAFFMHKAELEAELLINEALNDELVFKLYELLPEDKTLQDVLKVLEPQTSISESQSQVFEPIIEVLRSEGFPVGAYPERELSDAEKEKLKRMYLSHRQDKVSGKSKEINGMDFGIVEEIAGKLKVSPKAVVEELKKIDELPPAAVKDVLSEHIQALILEIMKEDDDGIVPLHSNTRERNLFQRLQDNWKELGIGDHYDQIERYLGMDIDKYLKKQFFKDHARRFKNRPIIWHLVSDKENISFFVLHHKWNQDKLLLLKSKYLTEIENTLNNMLASETDKRKRQKFIAQLDELEAFGKKLSELLDEGYDPKIDDGVAKNIVPLQHKGLLKADVLNGKLKNKMLKVEW